MTVVQRQVHGYKQGHQLLASSISLPKEDQAVINRLSDVAGPLRPRERFSSYLTTYPLPSGERVVLARTWQDLTVARAGCVRTVSLVIQTDDWARAADLSRFLSHLATEGLPSEADATAVEVEVGPPQPLPPVIGFSGNELLEALFLEDPRPVVVFEAADSELIATRLLTALWPSLRRRFALCSFALSPRKVAGRDFDVVFAPKDARAKFADWNGRKVDGRSAHPGRHRWTRPIVGKVFDAPFPQLLSADEIELVGGGGTDVDNAAALRIALLWDELTVKLDTMPTAALGLLDIANSGKVRNSSVLAAIEPSLARAAHEASAVMPEAEAWSFLGAISRKLQTQRMPMGSAAVADAVERLAGQAPEGAVALLMQDDPRGVVSDLLPHVARGIGGAFSDKAERALLDADPELLGQLLAQGGPLVNAVASDQALVDHLNWILPQLDQATLDIIRRNMLPLLTENWQLPAAEPLLARLEGQELVEVLQHLGVANDFAAEQLSGIVLKRALATAGAQKVRLAVASLPQSIRRDEIVAQTLKPTVADARWVATSDSIDAATSDRMLFRLLHEADDQQLASIVADDEMGERALKALNEKAPDLLLRSVSGETLPLAVFVEIVPIVVHRLSGDAAVKLATHVLRRCLPQRFGVDEIGFLSSMLDIVGDQLDGGWVARIGLTRDIEPEIVNRNMLAFRKASQPARLRVVWSIADVAEALCNRHEIDLDAPAAEACAAFIFDAEKVTPSGLLSAAGLLIPKLMRSRSRPVSLIVAAAFPSIYRELAKADDVPDFLKLFTFYSWDRCKAARHELIDAFMSSSWPPRDLLLTACRINEVGKILGRVSRQRGGKDYVGQMVQDLASLPQDCRERVEIVVAGLQAYP